MSGEAIWETHPQTTEEYRDTLAKIERERLSAVVHNPWTSYWWAYVRGEFFDTWDSKYPALQAVRDWLSRKGSDG